MKKLKTTPIRLDEAAMYFWSNTYRMIPSRATVRNWIKNGKKNKEGSVVMLKGAMVKNSWYTCRGHIDDFIEGMGW